jgi:uroporphyrinogen-III decarboxylase
MAPDGLHTIEAPPTGNCTFTQAYAVTGDSVTLIGNIQYDCFRSYTPPQMAEAVRAVIAECRGKRFILSPTAGPYEPEIPHAMVENYLAFLKTGWEAGAHIR